MGKLRVLSGERICEILANHGFVEVRRRSSHVMMQRPDSRRDDDSASPRPQGGKDRHASVNHPSVRCSALEF